jgi:hypothetical protein
MSGATATADDETSYAEQRECAWGGDRDTRQVIRRSTLVTAFWGARNRIQCSHDPVKPIRHVRSEFARSARTTSISPG